jgi:hypothetical protein
VDLEVKPQGSNLFETLVALWALEDTVHCVRLKQMDLQLKTCHDILEHLSDFSSRSPTCFLEVTLFFKENLNLMNFSPSSWKRPANDVVLLFHFNNKNKKQSFFTQPFCHRICSLCMLGLGQALKKASPEIINFNLLLLTS